MARHWTVEEKEGFRVEAIAMRRAGIGLSRIANQLGVSKAFATELVRGEPVPSSLMRMRAKDDLREAALALRREGRTYDEIKVELGVSKGSLSLWLRDLAHPTGAQREAVRSGAGQAPSLDVPPDAEIARALRLDGWLLREIAEELGISAPLAHRWCRGLPIPPRASHGRSPEELRAMNRANWDRKLAEREEERRSVTSQAAARIGPLSARELELVAVTAYWCEGQKSKPWALRERLIFINSDPDLIRVWVGWLRRRGVTLDQCRLSLSIHESADLSAATSYWAAVLDLPVDRFAKPALKKHNPRTVRKNTGDTYVGCLVIAVRQSRLLYQELAGLWQGIARGALDAGAAL